MRDKNTKIQTGRKIVIWRQREKECARQKDRQTDMKGKEIDRERNREREREKRFKRRLVVYSSVY